MSTRTIPQSRRIRPMLRLVLLLALCLGALPFMARPVGAADYTVNVTTTADTPHACASTGTGTCSLRDAVRFANTKSNTNQTTINVPAGIYYLGGAAGEDAALGGDLDLNANIAIIGADRTTTFIDGQSADRVFDVSAGHSVSLSRLTIRYGKAGDGGGIRNGGTLAVNDCTVALNVADGGAALGRGGGIANLDSGKLAITGSSIIGNEAHAGNGGGGEGAGIFNSSDSAVTLSIVGVTSNTADGGGNFGGVGGGIFHGGTGTMTIQKSDIESNHAGSSATGGGTGGGIYHGGAGALTVENSEIGENIAHGASNGPGGQGGGIANAKGPLLLTAATIRENTAGAGGVGFAGGTGGGLVNTSSTALTISESTFSGNSAAGNVQGPGLGGAIRNDSGAPSTIVNSTFSANKANDLAAAGGIYNTKNANLTLTHVTLTANSKALITEAGGSGSLVVRNSIVADSTSGANCAGAIGNGGYNLDSGATCGFDSANGSASGVSQPLGPLTKPAPFTAAVHPISGPGPAVDRVPAQGANCPALDERGMVRPQGAACDSGAYEYAPQGFPVTITHTGNGTVTPASGTYSGTITLTATPDAGQVFTGWTVDNVFCGWASPATLTVAGPHTVVATFVARPSFPDVPANAPEYEAISQLAARGIIKGYGNGNFGPGDTTLRAQMAALIARAMGWEAEDWGTPFIDQGGLEANLWRNVGTLAHYGVAYGYGNGIYGPNDKVTQAQTISFITRAMVAKGYWQPQPDDPALAPNVPASSGHRADIATFVHYAGAIPGTTPAADWADWNAPATRGWFALAEWQALNSYWGVDLVP